MMLFNVPARYDELFGRPLYLAEYNVQRLAHLIYKMKDTLVIKGEGTSKTLHLAKKETGHVTNKHVQEPHVPEGDKAKNAVEEKHQNLPHTPLTRAQTGSGSSASMSDINVEDFTMVDIPRTNLTSFKQQLEELLVIYSFHIPLKDFMVAYQQRFAKTLNLPSFGVDSLKALLEKVTIVFKTKFQVFI